MSNSWPTETIILQLMRIRNSHQVHESWIEYNFNECVFWFLEERRLIPPSKDPKLFLSPPLYREFSISLPYGHFGQYLSSPMGNDTILRFSDVFRRYRKRSVAFSWLIFYSFAGTNGCFGSDFKSKCDFICLPVGEKNYTCECPDNLQKKGDTCKCPTAETLVNGECRLCK